MKVKCEICSKEKSWPTSYIYSCDVCDRHVCSNCINDDECEKALNCYTELYIICTKCSKLKGWMDKLKKLEQEFDETCSEIIDAWKQQSYESDKESG